MRTIIIPGSFKSTITSRVAGDIIRQRYSQLRPYDEIEQIVITDGGEGTIEAFERNFGGYRRSYIIRSMQNEWITTDVYWLDSRSVVIESASVVGYSKISQDKRNPWTLFSYGIGDLILDVKRDGARKIYITMGDSAIMDMGIGMLCALGVIFYDGSGNKINFTNISDINNIYTIDIEYLNKLDGIEIVVLSDTKDYFYGENGQTYMYGTQKGLKPEQAPLVESSFKKFGEIIRRNLNVDLANVPLSSGSGGLAASLYAFTKAKLLHCPEFLNNRIDFMRKVAQSDILITGEGQVDNQTKWGKIPHFVTKDFTGHCFVINGHYTSEGYKDLVEYSKGRIHMIKLENYESIGNPHLSMARATEKICSLIGSYEKQVKRAL